MLPKIEFVCLLLLFVFSYSFSYSQNPPQNTNTYKYIKESPRSKDSFKVKEGYWIEEEVYTDSLFSVGTSVDGTSKDDGKESRTIGIGIITSKGNYLDNMKNGIWQYFWDNKIYKEVEFEHGYVQSIKYYYDSGRLALSSAHKPGYNSPYNEKFHFERYDVKGNKIWEGDVPAMLISSGLSLPY